MKISWLSFTTLFFLILITSSCEKDEDSKSVNTFTDSRDGKVYKTVTIGNQVWMAENLNYETASGSWVYDDIPDYASTYGKLYNWKTACEVCPSGWHLPSATEWAELENYLIANGYNYDGSTTSDKIGKSLAATSGWNYSNETGDIGNDLQSNNSTGFNALPGGCLYYYGEFDLEGDFAYFWSSTEEDSNYAWYRIMCNEFGDLYINSYYKDFGFSVRCVKD